MSPSRKGHGGGNTEHASGRSARILNAMPTSPISSDPLLVFSAQYSPLAAIPSKQNRAGIRCSKSDETYWLPARPVEVGEHRRRSDIHAEEIIQRLLHRPTVDCGQLKNKTELTACDLRLQVAVRRVVQTCKLAPLGALPRRSIELRPEDFEFWPIGLCRARNH